MQNEGFQHQFLKGGQTFLCLTVQEYAIMLATASRLLLGLPFENFLAGNM